MLEVFDIAPNWRNVQRIPKVTDVNYFRRESLIDARVRSVDGVFGKGLALAHLNSRALVVGLGGGPVLAQALVCPPAVRECGRRGRRLGHCFVPSQRHANQFNRRGGGSR